MISTIKYPDIQIGQNMMECTPHGNYEFPFVIYLDDLREKVMGFVNWHWHKELQLCYVTEGTVSFFVNSKQYDISEGGGIFINQGCLHMIKPKNPPFGTFICYDFNEKLLSVFPGSVFETKYVTPYKKAPDFEAVPLSPDIEWQNKVIVHLITIYQLAQEQTFGFEYSIQSELTKLWLMMIQNNKGNGSEKHHPNNHASVVHSIIQYIQNHYSEKITIQNISAVVMFSESECCRIFKSILHETISSYIKTYRIYMSTELLKNTEKPLDLIAEETGFCSTSYYIKSFKEVMQITPNQFRKQL